MTEPKFTKGPLCVAYDDSERNYLILEETGIGRHIARTAPGGVPIAEEIANAYLFAAAPKMYEMLSKARAYLGTDHCAEAFGLLSRIDAALAEAEGRES